MSKCPFLSMQQKVTQTPQKLNLRVLNPPQSNYGEWTDDWKGTKYAEEFKKLDLNAVKADLKTTLKTSQEWWPADYGHYGPLMCRLAWHSAGTYRTSDGRGGANTGNMRFNPLDSWPDNGNLDKARRLLWPIKQKYGSKLSWGDLMILAANVGMEDMGFKIFGFSGGRADCWANEETYWGEGASFENLANDPSKLENPLGAIVMSLIYVNPEGPDGIPDPMLAAGHIRETFGRMAMNDEETVALIAGGHTFGKCHGAAPGSNCGAPPSDAPIEQQGFGWKNSHGNGKGADTITSGLEGAWTAKPAAWDGGYFHNLFTYEWELHKGPGGANQWRPKGGAGSNDVPDAHIAGKTHQPMMLTTDLALIKDPKYLEISKRYHADLNVFTEAFGKAWYKLTHRDMGPIGRCLGSDVAPEQIWQDPVPKGNASIDVAGLKKAIGGAGIDPVQLVLTAWASASTFRHTDFRGGANGARINLAPQKDWAINKGCADVIAKLNGLKGNASLADVIVLGGCVGVEMCAKKGGSDVTVPFKAGRGDATQDKTDANSFAPLEPKFDAFRNYNANPHNLVDRAHLLTLTAPEMTALVGGMRAMGANAPGVGNVGVLTATPGALTNDWFLNLLDMSTEWVKKSDNLFEGVDRANKGSNARWTASAADLAFGSNAELRALAERYAQSDSKPKFLNDFVAAWSKVMHLDLY